ncbi:MAG: hypothetical protein ABJF23_00215 [Bryobacteraceae bacterium]
MSAVEGASEAGFVTQDEVERQAVGGEVGDCSGGTIGLFDGRFPMELRGFPLDHSTIERDGFEIAGALHTPAGGYHVMHQVALDGVSGIVEFDVVLKQFVELLAGFGGEDDGFGCEAMTDGVHRGFLYSFRGFLSGCEGSVAAFA